MQRIRVREFYVIVTCLCQRAIFVAPTFSPANSLVFASSVAPTFCYVRACNTCLPSFVCGEERHADFCSSNNWFAASPAGVHTWLEANVTMFPFGFSFLCSALPYPLPPLLCRWLRWVREHSRLKTLGSVVRLLVVTLEIMSV